jgi:hypothetical protein
VIVFTFLLSIALYHLIKILKSVRRIIDRVEAGTMTLADDINELKTYIVEESFLSRFLKTALKRKTARNSDETPQRRTPLRELRPERKQKTELKIKNEG